MTNLDKYLEMTGETFSDLMQGASTFGPGYIEDTIIPKALKEKKKIVWVPDLKNGQDLGLVKFKLKDL